MKEIEITTKIPTTMTMNIIAIYNDEKKYWEVTIQEIGTDKIAKTNEPAYYQRETQINICDECDGYVIPVAILEHNGIDTTKIRFAAAD